MLSIRTSVPENFFRNQILLDYSGRWLHQSCLIVFQSVHSDVSGKGSNFAIFFSANRSWPLQLLYYRTTVIMSVDKLQHICDTILSEILDKYALRRVMKRYESLTPRFVRNYLVTQKNESTGTPQSNQDGGWLNWIDPPDSSVAPSIQNAYWKFHCPPVMSTVPFLYGIFPATQKRVLVTPVLKSRIWMRVMPTITKRSRTFRSCANHQVNARLKENDLLPVTQSAYRKITPRKQLYSTCMLLPTRVMLLSYHCLISAQHSTLLIIKYCLKDWSTNAVSTTLPSTGFAHIWRIDPRQWSDFNRDVCLVRNSSWKYLWTSSVHSLLSWPNRHGWEIWILRSRTPQWS